MPRLRYLLVVMILATAPANAQRNAAFGADCVLPFESIKTHRWIDGYCGPEGSAGSSAGKVQNRAKNEFCASGIPVSLTLSDFKSLQRAADDAGIHRKPRGIPSPEWRAKLEGIWTTDAGMTVGEGELVSFIGYIDKAFHAGEEHGESVNCKIPGAENNDIHLELGEAKKPNKCDRLITEISPHYRPASWTVGRLIEISQRGHPIRVTGHLFWDASHSPCGPGEPEQWRATSWEIHPVYKIEVCAERDLNECRSGGDNVWVGLRSAMW